LSAHTQKLRHDAFLKTEGVIRRDNSCGLRHQGRLNTAAVARNGGLED
jgi:hypothetical protein